MEVSDEDNKIDGDNKNDCSEKVDGDDGSNKMMMVMYHSNAEESCDCF